MTTQVVKGDPAVLDLDPVAVWQEVKDTLMIINRWWYCKYFVNSLLQVIVALLGFLRSAALFYHYLRSLDNHAIHLIRGPWLAPFKWFLLLFPSYASITVVWLHLLNWLRSYPPTKSSLTWPSIWASLRLQGNYCYLRSHNHSPDQEI